MQEALGGEELTPMQQFVRGNFFQNLTLFVIVLNGFWIGIDVEWNHPSLCKNGKCPLEPTSIIVENAFCVYFTFEILARIVAFGKNNLFDEHLKKWFYFDSVLVVFMVIETWILLIVEALSGGGGDGILSKFSCLRLLRLTRLTRIMHSLPELLTLVKGIMRATRAVSVVLMFMVMLMYIFAIVFTAQIGDPMAPERFEDDPYWVRDTDPTGPELFGSMGDSMMTLFTRGLLGDNLAETLQAIKDRSGKYSCTGEGDDRECTREGGELWLMWVFIVFMIISAFCLLNMLVGVLCEVIDETAKDEAACGKISQLDHHIRMAFWKIDSSGDDAITRKEWAEMRTMEDVRKCFENIGVEKAFIDDRLSQIEEHLFERLDKNLLLDDEYNWKPAKAQKSETIPSDSEEANGPGIPLEEFVDHICEIRPDSCASFLDFEILRTRAEMDEKVFNHQLDLIEGMLNQQKDRQDAAKGLYGGGAMYDVSQFAQPVDEKQQRLSEEPNNGTSGSDPWILGLPTEALFAELKHRASRGNSSGAEAEILE
jgi:hypothetical protein